MSQSADRIDYLCAHCKPSWELSDAVIQIISDAPQAERGDLLTRYLAGYKYADCQKDETLPRIEKGKGGAEGIRIAFQATRDLQSRHLSEAEFHQQLWQVIEAVQDPWVRLTVVNALVQIEDLPYVNTDRTTTLPSDELRQHRRQLDPFDLYMIRHIAHIGVEQDTQRASLLLSILARAADDTQRTVMLTAFIHEMDNC